MTWTSSSSPPSRAARTCCASRPHRRESRADLRGKLAVAAGGVVFTTIQKFFPEERGDTYPMLSTAATSWSSPTSAPQPVRLHRRLRAAHAGRAANASFVGFTAPPSSCRTPNTRAVFGDYISVYDVRRSVQDGATVPIYYEGRLAKLILNEDQRPPNRPGLRRRDRGRGGRAEGAAEDKVGATRGGSRCGAARAADRRGSHCPLRAAAGGHVRQSDGGGMSRRICIDLYRELVRIRPEWHDDDDGPGRDQGGDDGSATDPIDWQPHHPQQATTRALAKPSATPMTHSRSCWCATCGSPASTLRACTPCTSTSPCAATGCSRPSPASTVSSATSPVASSWTTLAWRRTFERPPSPTRRAAARAKRRVDQGEAVAVHAGEARGLLRHLPRLRLVGVGDRHGTAAAGVCFRRRRSTCWRRRTVRTDSTVARARTVAVLRAGVDAR